MKLFIAFTLLAVGRADVPHLFADSNNLQEDGYHYQLPTSEFETGASFVAPVPHVFTEREYLPPQHSHHHKAEATVHHVVQEPKPAYHKPAPVEHIPARRIPTHAPVHHEKITLPVQHTSKSVYRAPTPSPVPVRRTASLLHQTPAPSHSNSIAQASVPEPKISILEAGALKEDGYHYSSPKVAFISPAVQKPRNDYEFPVQSYRPAPQPTLKPAASDLTYNAIPTQAARKAVASPKKDYLPPKAVERVTPKPAPVTTRKPLTTAKPVPTYRPSPQLQPKNEYLPPQSIPRVERVTTRKPVTTPKSVQTYRPVTQTQPKPKVVTPKNEYLPPKPIERVTPKPAPVTTRKPLTTPKPATTYRPVPQTHPKPVTPKNEYLPPKPVERVTTKPAPLTTRKPVTEPKPVATYIPVPQPQPKNEYLPPKQVTRVPATRRTVTTAKPVSTYRPVTQTQPKPKVVTPKNEYLPPKPIERVTPKPAPVTTRKPVTTQKPVLTYRPERVPTYRPVPQLQTKPVTPKNEYLPPQHVERTTLRPAPVTIRTVSTYRPAPSTYKPVTTKIEYLPPTQAHVKKDYYPAATNTASISAPNPKPILPKVTAKPNNEYLPPQAKDGYHYPNDPRPPFDF